MSLTRTVLHCTLLAAALAVACGGSHSPSNSSPSNSSPSNSPSSNSPSSNSPSSNSPSSKLTVLITDAPAKFSAAVVTISKVTLVGSGGEITLSSTPKITSLLTLSNDAASMVDNVVVPAGTYSELRFYITGGYIQVPGATAGTSEIFASSPTYEGLPSGAQVSGQLKMPSLAQSGLKVDFGSDLTLNTDSKILLVDFDVAQSFGHDAGNSGSWVMHPVIKGADLILSGNANVTAKLGAGVTLPVLSGTQVTLADFNAVLTNSGGSSKSLALTPTAAGSTTYGASFKYLLPGTYSLTLQAPAGMSFTSSPAVPVSVTIAGGQNSQTDFTITAASAP